MDSNNLIITPLGTVSPYCNGDKNCPGYLVEYKGKKVLLDCGPGISKYFNMQEDLNDLIIVISHLDYDHYLGLGEIAHASYVYKNLGYLNDKVKVYLPHRVVNPIDMMDPSKRTNIKTAKFHYPLTNHDFFRYFDERNYLEFLHYAPGNSIKHGEMILNFSENPHDILTYSTKIKTDDNDVVYSSDTGYNGNSLEKFAKNANLFICESTYLKGQPKTKDNHLYTYEAAKIARDANVEQLVLTHFWPELDKELYVNEAKVIFSNTIAAEEGKKLVLRRTMK